MRFEKRKIAGKLPEKKRKFQKTEMDGSVFQNSVFFPAFFKKSGEMPEKNGFIFFRPFAFRVRFWVKNGTKTGQNPENPYED